MNDDTISRKAAIEILWEEPSYSDPLNVLTEARDRIKSLPSAERHGRWTRYEYSTNNRWRKCSVCGMGDEYINEFGFVAIRNYCPNCGAKMSEVEDE